MVVKKFHYPPNKKNTMGSEIISPEGSEKISP